MWSLAAPWFFLLLPLPLLAARLLPHGAMADGALRVPVAVAEGFPRTATSPAAAAIRSLLPWLIWCALEAALCANCFRRFVVGLLLTAPASSFRIARKSGSLLNLRI